MLIDESHSTQMPTEKGVQEPNNVEIIFCNIDDMTSVIKGEKNPDVESYITVDNVEYTYISPISTEVIINVSEESYLTKSTKDLNVSVSFVEDLGPNLDSHYEPVQND